VAATVTPSSSSPIVTIGLTEYSALRAEIVHRLESVRQFVVFDLTAVATLYGLVISQKAMALLLLVVPPLTASLGLLWLDQMRILTELGSYLRKELWPRLGAAVGEPLPDWEARLAGAYHGWVTQLAYSTPVVILFALPGLGALIISFPHLNSPWLFTAWASDVLLSGGATAAAAWITRKYLRPHNTARPVPLQSIHNR
jgi:hypothetical protein